jgi:hypothetical protein
MQDGLLLLSRNAEAIHFLASQDGPNNQPELSHLPLMLFCHR